MAVAEVVEEVAQEAGDLDLGQLQIGALEFLHRADSVLAAVVAAAAAPEGVVGVVEAGVAVPGAAIGPLGEAPAVIPCAAGVT